ncbi:MAG: tol-pal system protein YbgF [Deltaproteobacteria bacterium]|nr:tol-pal system protein YbgF [Deltaproteobacteria bacterium]
MQKTLMQNMFLVAAAVALLGACAPKSDVDALQSRVRFQDQQLQQMQPAQADTWAQIQAIRQELAALRGQMDDLQSAGGARVLAEKVNKHDVALRQVESALALNFNLDSPGAAYTPAPAYAPVGGGQYALPGIVADSGAADVQHPGGVPIVAAAPPAAQKDTATALYDSGLTSYNARNYQEALRAFTDFTKTYGSHKLAPNAWYYAGESNFQLNRFADAALAYDTVITKYGASQRAPAAYLKQALAFGKLGQKDAADARLKELIRKFPNSPEAARAKQLSQQIR